MRGEQYKLYVHMERWINGEPSWDEPEAADPMPVEFPNNTDNDLIDDFDKAKRMQEQLATFYLKKKRKARK